MLSQCLASRIINWKFTSAFEVCSLQELTQEQKDLLEALHKVLGNVGWITDGYMATIISMALQGAFPELFEEE